jgi:predicted SnoaL-like aldol condensation-catalyzing enzyme
VGASAAIRADGWEKSTMIYSKKPWTLLTGIAAILTCHFVMAQEPVTGASDPEALFTSRDRRLNANKQVILHIVRDLLEAGHWNDAPKYLTRQYLQHNPNVASGLEPVMKFFSGSPSRPIPERNAWHTRIVSVIAEGDLVVVATVREMPIPQDPAKTYTTTWFDMWRIKDGKADEHWDGATLPPAPQKGREPIAPPPSSASSVQVPGQAGMPALVELTADQDHQRILNLLHIPSLRPGANGMNPQAANYANYDETKANPYPHLPDPLTLKNGKKVTTTGIWWQQRRPEIVEDFDREVYGRVPAKTPAVQWEVTGTTRETQGDVPVIIKQLIGHVDNAAYPLLSVNIQLTVTTPANATGPVPVMMQFGFIGGRGGFARPGAPPPGIVPRAPGAGGNLPSWQAQVLAKGWGYAILSPNSIQPDNGAGLTHGIIGLVNKGQPRGVEDWGVLRAWAWGASRALDYLATDKAVDAKQVGLEGHSRYGKATIVAMAYDPRFAIAYVSSSGEGGAKLHRRNWGEQVENVAGGGEYHWMAGNFVKYAGPLTAADLPVDSHELVALCAPRPVFLSAGATNGDGWVDAKGTFLAGVGASPVYALLGKKGLNTPEFPPIETSLLTGDLAFRQHSAGHTDGPNWPFFLTFADRYIHAPPLPATQSTPSDK